MLTSNDVKATFSKKEKKYIDAKHCYYKSIFI